MSPRFVKEDDVETNEEEPYDLTGNLIEYEMGELDEEGYLKLFQYIVDHGLDGQLQGSYGREAQRLIDAGEIKPRS